MSKKATTELELKVEMDVGDLRALQARAAKGVAPLENGTIRRLRSIYFDTPDYAIRRAGLSLRLRDVDGAWVQTVKAKTAVKGGVSNPLESEAAVQGAKPQTDLIENPELRERLDEIINGSLILPVFETVVERTSYDLVSKNGTHAELAIDMGHVFSDKGLMPIGEAELELKSGNVVDLIEIATTLFDGSHCKLASQNKATLGYMLIGAEEAEERKPRRIALPPFLPGQSVESAFIQQMDHVVDGILHNWIVMTRSEDPEGPHQLRISLRLLRSLLKAFRPVLGGPSLRAIDRRARDLGRLVGQLRDMDVLIDDIYWPVMASNAVDIKDDAFSHRHNLAARLSRHRELVRRHILSELQQWSAASFQMELALLTKQKPWRRDVSNAARKAPISKLSKRALDRSYNQAKKRGDHLAKLSLEERHAMRKSLKTLRYQGQIFSSLYASKRAKGFNKRLKALQDVFGYLNDVLMAQKLDDIVRQTGNWDKRDDEIVAFILLSHNKQATKAWKKAQKRWHQFDQAKMFWH